MMSNSKEIKKVLESIRSKFVEYYADFIVID